MRKLRICLITHTHVASNPRLVKEADALHRAGFQVKVIYGDLMPAVRTLDKTILDKAPWPYTRIESGSPPVTMIRMALQKSARIVASSGWIPHLSIAVWAHFRLTHKLASVASMEPADLYIAHNLAALPAAAIAARRRQARLGFDAEDFHIGELSDDPRDATELAVRHKIERTLLPFCEHLTAASPGIARAYHERYQVSMKPILNVFPLAEAPASPERQGGDRCGPEPSIYWFSQTIGPGRGLEEIIKAAGRMRTRVRLHLRGTPASKYREQLAEVARAAGLADRLHFLPPAPPGEMVRLAACHDMGLSVEPGRDLNNRLCLGNKIFTYLLAGVPFVMSRTPAQEEIAQDLGKAALLVDIHNTGLVAAALDGILSDQAKRKRARQMAWRLGQQRYNWDVEQEQFLQSVTATLN